MLYAAKVSKKTCEAARGAVLKSLGNASDVHLVDLLPPSYKKLGDFFQMGGFNGKALRLLLVKTSDNVGQGVASATAFLDQVTAVLSAKHAAVFLTGAHRAP
jgi:hypothetical protein